MTYVRAQGCSLVRRLEDVDHHPADKDMHMQLQISSGYYLQGTHTGHHPSILFMKFDIVWLSIKWKNLKCLAARCLDSVNRSTLVVTTFEALAALKAEWSTQ